MSPSFVLGGASSVRLPYHPFARYTCHVEPSTHSLHTIIHVAGVVGSSYIASSNVKSFAYAQAKNDCAYCTPMRLLRWWETHRCEAVKEEDRVASVQKHTKPVWVGK